MTEEYQLTLADYLSILRRRWYWLVFPTLLFLGITVAVALLMPPIYQAKATILVESQQIPQDLVASTVTSYAEERIQVIKQRVMTRENLMKIADKYQIFQMEGSPPSVSEKTAALRELIGVDLVSVGQSGKRSRDNKHALAFTLSFDHRNPQIAQKVANELVTLFLNENLETRTLRATETSEFLAREAEKLKRDLEKTENLIAEYKVTNRDALPEHLSINEEKLQRAKDRINDLTRELKSHQEQLNFLEIELASVGSKSAGDGGVSLVGLGPEQQLAQLEAQLADKSLTYGSAHPEIRKLKRKIAAVRKKLAANPAQQQGDHTEQPAVATNPAQLMVQAKIASVKSSISSLNQQRQTLDKTIEALEERIIRTPEVERGFKSLSRDYENMMAKYKELRAKMEEAKLSLSMEEQSKAERFSIIETPILPEKPVKPNRGKILMIGAILSLGAGFGLIFGREMFDQSIWGQYQLASVLRAMPLVSIPYIETEEDVRRRKRRIKAILIAAAISMVVSLLALHLFYKPLDMIWLTILSRISALT